MRAILVAAAVLCGLSLGCSKSEEAPAATAPEATSGAEATATGTSGTNGATTTIDSVIPTQPDTAKFKAYVGKMQYPATREQVLAASEQSPDFTASEKKWLSTNLPEGNYTSGDAVLSALKVE